ncbi:MAG: hypothetical protein KKD01_19680, partial [Proteobacteria bacterium]|nr:hypothetical protein [Pseudomonadota bacterium]MBU1456942.1 hypothetical protein [Pseudomonadota bacterium]
MTGPDDSTELDAPLTSSLDPDQDNDEPEFGRLKSSPRRAAPTAGEREVIALLKQVEQWRKRAT